MRLTLSKMSQGVVQHTQYSVTYFSGIITNSTTIMFSKIP